MQTKISVIIPVHNGAKYVRKAIRSVLEQDYHPLEVIVIDDGSTDESPEILRSFGDNIILKRIPNGGVSQARNLGLEMATGGYIALIDHDDVWFKHKLSRQAELLERFPSVGLVASNCIVRYAHLGHRLVRYYSHIEDADYLNFDEPLAVDPFRSLIRENFICTPSSVLLRRSVADKAGNFDKEDDYAQDYSYWIRCALFTDFLITSDVLFYKRTHRDNISSDAVRTCLAHARILDLQHEQNPGRFIAPEIMTEWRRARSCIEYKLGNAYFERGDAREAFVCYARGLRRSSTPQNFLKFLRVTSFKSLRFLSGGFLSRRSFGALRPRYSKDHRP